MKTLFGRWVRFPQADAFYRKSFYCQNAKGWVEATVRGGQPRTNALWTRGGGAPSISVKGNAILPNLNGWREHAGGPVCSRRKSSGCAELSFACSPSAGTGRECRAW